MNSRLSVALAVLSVAPLLRAAAPGPVKNRAPLAPNAFYPLPLTSVRPAGWLRDQLRLQAQGLTGHLDEFWPDVGPDSAWLGGTGEGWERGPYYLDGLLPLAYLLDDPKLIAKARPWVEWTLTHQAADGALGPPKNRDWWPIMIMLKVLTQYQEATGDPRVIPAMDKYFAYQSRSLAANPLKQWAVYRWQDELASVLWLYNRNGDSRLLDFARQLKGEGFDWRKLFENFPFPGKMARDRAGLSSHGVKNAMGLKTARYGTDSRDPADRSATARMFEVLDRYDGLPNGMFSADEHFAGRIPRKGPSFAPWSRPCSRSKSIRLYAPTVTSVCPIQNGLRIVTGWAGFSEAEQSTSPGEHPIKKVPAATQVYFNPSRGFIWRVSRRFATMETSRRQQRMTSCESSTLPGEEIRRECGPAGKSLR